MKQRRMMLTVWMLFCLVALPALAAEPMLTLVQLREQTPVVWQGEYENRTGRSVRFSAPVLMPQSDIFPVARMVRHESTAEALSSFADALAGDEERAVSSMLHIRRFSLMDAAGAVNQKEGLLYNTGETQGVYHHLWARGAETGEIVYAENQTLSLAGAAQELERLTKALYGEAYGVLIDEAGVRGAPYVMGKGKKIVGPLDLGAYTGMGSYDLKGILTLDGIPLLGGPKFHQGFGLRYREHLVNYNYHGAEFTTYISPELFGFYGDAYRIREIIHEDVPLCSFNEIQKAVEKLIERDKVQHVYALYLGWVLWLDPSIDYPTKKSGIAEGLRMPYLATPVWLVECCYASSTGRDFSEYPQTDTNGAPYNYRSHAWGVEMLMINAQTAEVFDPWDEHARRKFAPDVIAW